ncbi:Hypothetical predicted protein [Marmota monax]|nr:Hypothetical predicted protein [Marmota monax]
MPPLLAPLLCLALLPALAARGLRCSQPGGACLNGGRCQVVNSTEETCVCSGAFVGQRCQDPNPCLSSPCKNAGTCRVVDRGGAADYACICPLGFSGPLCLTPLDNACLSSPCRNGGTCDLVTLTEYKCRCPPGWSGKSCQQADPCASNPCANGGQCLPFESSYICGCPPGFHGPTCRQDVNECSQSPGLCRHGGTCHNEVGSYRCVCRATHTGPHCELPYVPCSPSPCQNGGTCRPTGDTTYECACLPGFTGQNCEENVDDCPGNGCKNGGACVDGVNTYNCRCPPEWTGQYCTEDVDECQLMPTACQNGGTCHNTLGGYNCVCVNGWTGEDCGENIDDCASAACFHGATCHDRVASFYCECPHGRTGLLCHLSDACISNPCNEGSNCDTNPVNGKAICTCPSGYTGPACSQDVDECALGANPCEHAGKCLNTLGSFECQCLQGYTGPRCEIDVNECVSNPCQNDATCLDQIGEFQCICMPGYEGVYCEVNMDECASSPCLHGGRCLDKINEFVCECPTGFSGHLCQYDVDECASTPCRNGARCLDGPNTYTCVCTEGYTGTHCEVDIDECDPDPCHYGSCKDGVATFTCLCQPGYTGHHCETNINECHSQPCRHGGTCQDRDNAYFCFCLKGTTGPNCEVNLDDCASSPCDSGTCLDKIDGYECACEPGYTGSMCNVNIDECAANPCHNGGTCEDGINGFTCHCPEGYHDPTCLSEVNECNSSPCVHGVCRDSLNGYKCDCEPGWSGTNCDINTNECESNPCVNGGTCKDMTSGYVCTCREGFSGPNCQTNINECASNPCLNQGTCIDDVAGYKCNCLLPYTGATCEGVLAPCAPSPCRNSGVCKESEDYESFFCVCPVGWQGQTCEIDVNECVKSPCRNGASCQNTNGSYRCLCQAGYTGRNCESDIDDCRPNPCHNGGSCTDGVNTAFCDCLPGFQGAFCEEDINECASNPCHHGANCTDCVDSYTCTCPAGFNGIHCENNTPDCTESSCFNGGTCVDGINAFTCLCPPGFTGSYCQHDINECDSRPCLHGGTCQDSYGTYKCTCPQGYTGLNCQDLVRWCDSSPCKNGGKCWQTNTLERWEGSSGWTGLYCDVPSVSCEVAAQQRGNQHAPAGPRSPEGRATSHNPHLPPPPGLKGPHRCQHTEMDIHAGNTHHSRGQAGYNGRHAEDDSNQGPPSPRQNGATCTDDLAGHPGKQRRSRENVLGGGSVSLPPAPLCLGSASTSLRPSCLAYETCPHHTLSKAPDLPNHRRGLNPLNPPGTAGQPDCCQPTRRSMTGYHGANCSEEINECLSHPCQNGGTCIDLTNTHKSPGPRGTQGKAAPQGAAHGHHQSRAPRGRPATNTQSHAASTHWRPTEPAPRDPEGCPSRKCGVRPPPPHHAGPEHPEGVHCEINVDDCSPPLDPAPRRTRAGNNATGADQTAGHSSTCPPGHEEEQHEGDVNECLSNPGHTHDTQNSRQRVNDFHCERRHSHTGRQGPRVWHGAGQQGPEGRRCESVINGCKGKPCKNGGTCNVASNTARGFICKRPDGFEGATCENDARTCGTLRCLHGGTCISGPRSPTCLCLAPFTGPECQFPASSPCLSGNPCYNQGSCEPTSESPFYRCLCPPKFNGLLCHILDYSFGGGAGRDIPPPQIEEACELPECQADAGNKVCSLQCNNHACGWDGGDCSLNFNDPWKNCTQSLQCWKYFSDGRCDSQCNSAGCLFDGFDCQHAEGQCNPLYDQYCKDHFSDGHCDQGCNSAECEWDGLDCAEHVPERLAAGTLVLVVLLPPQQLRNHSLHFLRELSRVLHTNVVFKRDAQGHQMIFPYYGHEEELRKHPIKRAAGWAAPGSLLGQATASLLPGSSRRQRRELDPMDIRGSIVYLEIDNRQCMQSSSQCFQSATDVAAFLGALASLGSLNIPYKIDAVQSETVEPPPPAQLHLMYVAAAAFVLLFFVGCGVLLSRKRRRQHGQLWFPEGFKVSEASKKKRREPLGEDSVGLKRLPGSPLSSPSTPPRPLKNASDGALMDESQNEWGDEGLETKKFRVSPVGPGLPGGWLTLGPTAWARDACAPMEAAQRATGAGVILAGGALEALRKEAMQGSGPAASPTCKRGRGPAQHQSPKSTLLREKGASLHNQTDRTGETALHLAARYSRSDAAKRLLEASADANIQDNMGRTPLHAAVSADAQGVFQILIRNRATDLDARMHDGTTPLILAARLAVEGMLEDLINSHADVNAVDDLGKSALHWAAAVNNVDAAIVLLKNGANKDMQNNKEETPLFLAAREGSYETAKVLLDHFANRDITDHMDRLPRDIAQERMHHDIVRLLDEHNLVRSPQLHGAALGSTPRLSPTLCSPSGYLGNLKPSVQGKKARKPSTKGPACGSKEARDLKARRKKSQDGKGCLLDSSSMLSPVDSLESPHGYLSDVASPPLLPSPFQQSPSMPLNHLPGMPDAHLGISHLNVAAKPEMAALGGGSRLAFEPGPPRLSHLPVASSTGTILGASSTGAVNFTVGGAAGLNGQCEWLSRLQSGMVPSQYNPLRGAVAPSTLSTQAPALQHTMMGSLPGSLSASALSQMMSYQGLPSARHATQPHLVQPQQVPQQNLQMQQQNLQMPDMQQPQSLQPPAQPHLGVGTAASGQLGRSLLGGEPSQDVQPLGPGNLTVHTILPQESQALPTSLPSSLVPPMTTTQFLTPPSQHSYSSSPVDNTPSHQLQVPEHPFLTPSPESPDQWSSSSPHSNISDWSEGISSPPTTMQSQVTHIPEAFK